MAVTVAARVISIFRPLQASATSSGRMPSRVLQVQDVPLLDHPEPRELEDVAAARRGDPLQGQRDQSVDGGRQGEHEDQEEDGGPGPVQQRHAAEGPGQADDRRQEGRGLHPLQTPLIGDEPHDQD